LDIQSAGELLELNQKFLVGHGFGNSPLRFCIAIRFGNVLWVVRPRMSFRSDARGRGWISRHGLQAAPANAGSHKTTSTIKVLLITIAVDGG
jgi:hypothetical protein